MKRSNGKPANAPEAPVFQIAIRKRGAKAKIPGQDAKPHKRDKIFSKSRDVREDRGTRQAKASSNPQTFPHGR